MAFRHPQILYALLLLLIPLLVHLLRLQRFRTLDFPNVEFLRQLERESRRSRKLRKYLLLATRMLILTFLVLAFAVPYIPQRKQETPRQMWIHIERSPFSLYQSGDQTALEQLLDDARKIVDRHPLWHLIDNQGNVQKLDAREAKQYFEDNSIYFLPANPGKILQQINNYDQNPKTVFFLTAGQDIDSRLRQFIKPENQYRFIIRSPENYVNTCIDTVFTAESGNATYRLACVVHRTGPATKTEVSLLTGKHLAGKMSLSLPANASDTAYFQIDKQSGAPQGLVSISSGGYLSWDDRLYFSLPPPRKPEILFVGDSLPGYWNKLFDAIDARLVKTEPGNIPFEQAAQFDLVIVRGWEAFLHAKEWEKRFNRADFVFVPSGNPEKDLIFFGSSAVKDTGRLDINDIRWKHPVFKGMFRKPPVNVYAPYTTLHYTAPLQTGEPVIMLENGDPFLKHHGRWWIFYAPLSGPYGNFYLSPLMSALFYRWSFRSGPGKPLYTYCDENTALEIPAPPDDVPVKLVKDNDSRIPYQEIRNGKRVLFPEAKGLKPGVYALVHGTDTLGFQAMNINRSESRFQPVNPKVFDGLPNVRVSDGFSGSRLLGGDKDLTRLMLWLALLFVLAEILIIRLWKVS